MGAIKNRMSESEIEEEEFQMYCCLSFSYAVKLWPDKN
jgi:hypothetical protein